MDNFFTQSKLTSQSITNYWLLLHLPSLSSFDLIPLFSLWIFIHGFLKEYRRKSHYTLLLLLLLLHNDNWLMILRHFPNPACSTFNAFVITYVVFKGTWPEYLLNSHSRVPAYTGIHSYLSIFIYIPSKYLHFVGFFVSSQCCNISSNDQNLTRIYVQRERKTH